MYAVMETPYQIGIRAAANGLECGVGGIAALQPEAAWNLSGRRCVRGRGDSAGGQCHADLAPSQ